MTTHELLADLYRQGFHLTPLPGGRLEVKPFSKLPEGLRQELKRRKAEVLAFLLSREQAFLGQHLPPAAQDVFPNWQGLLIKSAVLGMSVWVVRTRQEGEALARETGHPALLLDNVLAQKGRSREEARAVLLPLLITGATQ